MQGKPQPKKKLCFIVNPISGRKRYTNPAELITKDIDKNKFDFSIKYTESIGHAEMLAKDAVENKTDLVVAVGGDGTINEVASALIDTETILGIIPTGSGNGLARHLGIHRNFRRAIQLINDLHFKRIDTALINDRPFISIAGVGFDALVAKHFAENNKRGFLSYFEIITKKFLDYKPNRYTIQFSDRTVLKTRALFIAFSNSNQFGYNTTIAPNAKLNDGLLDVCIVQKPPLFAMPVIANLLLLKWIDRSQYVRIISSASLIVKRKRNRPVNIDGEPVKLKKNLSIKINPLSLKVIIPKDAKK